MTFEIGNSKQQQLFCKRHRLFLEKLPDLRNLVNDAFARKTETLSATVDQLVYFLGISCAEDFGEILLLCGNGYGIGAQKILRGMYERAVTAYYLHSHPEETESFVDFGRIRHYQSMEELKKVLGNKIFENHPERRENFERAKEQYEKLKQKFMVSLCKKCKTRRLNHTWSKLDFVTMAKSLKNHLGNPMILKAAYSEPTQQSHATMLALLTKMKKHPKGLRFGRDLKQEAETAAMVLDTAHAILLAVLALQMEHFGLTALEPSFQRCSQNLLEICGNPDHTVD